MNDAISKTFFLHGKACWLDRMTCTYIFCSGSSVVILKILIANGRYMLQNACVYILHRSWLQETNVEKKCSLCFFFVSVYIESLAQYVARHYETETLPSTLSRR